MKIFISQPMKGKSDEQIVIERNTACEVIRNIRPNTDVEFIDSIICDKLYEKHDGLKYLAHSIEMLDEADEIWMLPGWQCARGCVIEKMCAESYGITVHEY